MFPVDPRLGQAYCRGPQQFVEKIRTRYFVPMHFDESVAAEAFEPQVRAAGSTLLLPRERGRKFTLFTSPDTLSKTIQP